MASWRNSPNPDLATGTPAWRTLGSLSSHSPDAGVSLLLGLMQVHKDDLTRMLVLVEAVPSFSCQATAEVFKAEFLRVPSTPSTRTYLNACFKGLQRLRDRHGIAALKGQPLDAKVSLRWRRKFEEAVDDARRW